MNISVKLRMGAVLTFAALSMWPTPATAHAELESSTPAKGQKLDAMPSTVSITLNEKIAEPAFIAVTNAEGKRVNSTRVVVGGRTATSPVPNSDDAAGAYTMAYRVVSGDGHVISGSLKFSVAETSPSSPTATPETTPAPTANDDATITSGADGSGNNTFSIVVILGFFVLAFGGLVLLVRAGLKESGGDE